MNNKLVYNGITCEFDIESYDEIIVHVTWDWLSRIRRFDKPQEYPADITEYISWDGTICTRKAIMMDENNIEIIIYDIEPLKDEDKHMSMLRAATSLINSYHALAADMESEDKNKTLTRIRECLNKLEECQSIFPTNAFVYRDTYSILSSTGAHIVIPFVPIAGKTLPDIVDLPEVTDEPIRINDKIFFLAEPTFSRITLHTGRIEVNLQEVNLRYHTDASTRAIIDDVIKVVDSYYKFMFENI